ncbi:hypothetical protein CDL15_Pgr005344 [Punica granatum]|uniref:Uncharacterized protein n=1 Tax=Punica granatum TaxID=22663 RepID=A0A218XDC7_PUNGR|nr:hypothetical protein CDL15_Pgr005344 [Punica granatum]
MALAVKEASFFPGSSQSGDPERPLGATRLLMEEDKDEANLLLSWLAIGEAAAMENALFRLKKDQGRRFT